LVIAFGGIIAALWIAIEHWFNHIPAPTYIYPGFALIFQNIFIFLR
jgi:hypothetical protein